VWLVTEDAKKIHFWMRKVVLLPAPFSYVENPIAREVVYGSHRERLEARENEHNALVIKTRDA
jgi:hypothetical protein